MAPFEDRLFAILAAPHVKGLMADSRCAVLVASRQGRLHWASSGLGRLLGRPVEEYVGLNLVDFLLPEHARAFLQVPMLVDAEEPRMASLTMPLRVGEGRAMWFRFDAFAARGLYVAAMRPAPAPSDGLVRGPDVMPLKLALV